jgi:hypothetical protein
MRRATHRQPLHHSRCQPWGASQCDGLLHKPNTKTATRHCGSGTPGCECHALHRSLNAGPHCVQLGVRQIACMHRNEHKSAERGQSLAGSPVVCCLSRESNQRLRQPRGQSSPNQPPQWPNAVIAMPSANTSLLTVRALQVYGCCGGADHTLYLLSEVALNVSTRTVHRLQTPGGVLCTAQGA